MLLKTYQILEIGRTLAMNPEPAGISELPTVVEASEETANTIATNAAPAELKPTS